jgi:hypothetical protein
VAEPGEMQVNGFEEVKSFIAIQSLGNAAGNTTLMDMIKNKSQSETWLHQILKHDNQSCLAFHHVTQMVCCQLGVTRCIVSCLWPGELAGVLRTVPEGLICEFILSCRHYTGVDTLHVSILK